MSDPICTDVIKHLLTGDLCCWLCADVNDVTLFRRNSRQGSVRFGQNEQKNDLKKLFTLVKFGTGLAKFEAKTDTAVPNPTLRKIAK